MRPATALVITVVNEEIARLGAWDEGDQAHYVVQGTGPDGKPIDTITPVYEAAAARTGLPVARIRRIRPPMNMRPLGQSGYAMFEVRR